MAVLVHYDGYISSPSRVARIMGVSEAELSSSFESLFKMGLINQVPDADAVIITKLASMVISGNTALQELSDNEIIRRMKEHDLTEDDDEEPDLVDLFSDVLTLGPEGRIAGFVEKNRILSLSRMTQNLFWSLCTHYVQNFTAPYSLPFRKMAMSELIERGWVDTFASAGENANDLTKKENYCLSAFAAAKLFSKHEEIINYSTIATLGTFKSWQSIDEKMLFFNDSEKYALERMERIAGEQEYFRIKKGLEDKHLRISISAILHGPSGTGKTEFAMQVARKTKRNIILVDAGKLHGSYWGEDERNFRDLFRTFSHIEALSKNAPILFIDEGEGILGQRTANAQTRGDRSNNIVQNIILEELNNFHGLLFITTNNARNIDKAMDRRFLTKIEFHIPDENTRMRIWLSKYPSLSEEEAKTLSRTFAFSGGHIDNVITQVSIDELLDNKKCELDDLIKYCQCEEGFSSKTNTRRIGF